MTHVLVTGASGFVGSYFTSHYATQYTIHPFSFRTGTVTPELCTGINAIVHLSALVHQMGGASKEQYEQINIQQTMKLAHAAKDAGVKHFIFMSTVKVYGEETDTPYTEDSACTPLDDYGKSKLAAEQKLQALENEDFIVSIIRTPIVYGAGVKANMKSLIALTNKMPLLPFGKIKNSRSMVSNGNLCHLIATLINKQTSGVFLASDDEPLSTSQLIQLIAKELDTTMVLIRIPLFAMIVRLFKPMLYQRLYKSLEVDNSTTKEILSLENPLTIAQGVQQMIHGEES